MRLNKIDLKNKGLWSEKGYELPNYDIEKIKANTEKEPTWIHFGAGNIFRAFPAAELQKLLNSGEYNKGLIVSEGFDYNIIDRAYEPYDNLSLLVVLKADGTIDKKVIGSVVSAVKADINNDTEWSKLISFFENPSLQMASFTITEKGYSVIKDEEEYQSFTAIKSIMGKIALLCYKRYKKGEFPIALVSMDNCSHNGDKLHNAISTYANKWVANKMVDKGFVDYIENKQKVSFPLSMIDKITPRPDGNVKDMLSKDGFEDTDIIITDRNTYTAPFVNAEQAQYLVIEDWFPNGRPALEKTDMIFTTRDIVDKMEKMKVCTCLNPLHTALAIFGCILGFDTIFNEMKDDDLNSLVNKIGYKEGMPVVINPGIISPMDFLKEVVQTRLPNPFMPDTPQRIATDTSQKLPIRFGETIKAYVARQDLNVTDLECIPFVFAGWCRYLLGVNDNGEAFDISSDPMLEELKGYLNGIKLGEASNYKEKLKPILSNEKIFGVDLYKVGLATKVEKYFEMMISEKGAVRKALKLISK